MSVTYSHEAIREHMHLGTWTVRTIHFMVKQLLREVKSARDSNDELVGMLRGGPAKNMELLNAIRKERDDARGEIARLRMVLGGIPKLIDEADDADIGQLRAICLGTKAIVAGALDPAHA